MAWTKIPSEHHPVFRAALPDDKRVQALQMFGGVAGKVNGQMFSGLFARSAMVKLSDADYAEAMALDGAEPFDPMGKGNAMASSVLLPEDVFHDPEQLRSWVRRAFDYVLTLPKKAAKKPAAKVAKTKPAAKKVVKKPVAKAKAKAKPAKAKPAKKPKTKPKKT